LKFFSLTYAASWTFFITAVALARVTASTDQGIAAVRGLLVFIGTVSPALVALAITPRGSRVKLLDPLLQWRVPVRWYVFALGYMAAIKLTVSVACRVTTGTWPLFREQPVWLVIPAILVSLPFQSGEEIGWRGYALPRLAERLGMGLASLVVGLLWACWHLPLFYLAVPGNDEYGQSFPVWAMGVTALSVAFAWLYMRTNGSVLLTMLMHSAVNNMPHFAPHGVVDAKNVFSLHASPIAWLTTVLLWITGAYFLTRMRHIVLPARETETMTGIKLSH
jgi:membrane protease YdiL (CAAX protease family)